MLSRKLSLAALAGTLLLAGPVLAVTNVYDMFGSSMQMTNAGGCTPATCNVAVTGTVTLDDDLGGNVTLSDLLLSHVGYEVGSAAFGLSVIIDRDSISETLPLAVGAGTTLNGVTAFPGTTDLAQVGTATCTGPCIFAGLPAGVSPLGSPVTVALGVWTFDAFGNFTATIPYTVNAQATENLVLVGTLIPEPGTALLLAAGLVGMALRRRSVN